MGASGQDRDRSPKCNHVLQICPKLPHGSANRHNSISARLSVKEALENERKPAPNGMAHRLFPDSKNEDRKQNEDQRCEGNAEGDKAQRKSRNHYADIIADRRLEKINGVTCSAKKKHEWTGEK